MKTAIVPAQVTSVEDRIAGNLSFKQLLLMVMPVFLSAGLFVFLPPFTSYQVYKLVISIIVTACCLILALRIKGRLVLEWLLILSRYNKRPLLYIYDKNTCALRPALRHDDTVLEPTPLQVDTIDSLKPQLTYDAAHEITLEERLKNPAANMHFTFSKKGDLRVHIKEVE